jgi:regulatory protein
MRVRSEMSPAHQNPAEQAMAQALRLLRHRSRSRHELSLALARKGFEEAVVEATLHRLGELGYLDDARFARAKAVSLLGGGRLAEASVKQRLLSHGLSEAEADAAVQQAREEVGFDPLAAGKALLERRGLWGKPLDGRAQAQAGRLLAARGFSEDQVEALLRLASPLDPVR